MKGVIGEIVGCARSQCKLLLFILKSLISDCFILIGSYSCSDYGITCIALDNQLQAAKAERAN